MLLFKDVMYFSIKTWLLLMLAFAFMILLGLPSYVAFYNEIVFRLTGTGVIDWEKIASICGWANKLRPGETQWGYRLRSTWEMISGKMAMTTIYIVVLGFFYGTLNLVFRLTDRSRK
ncbi:MAG: hypothetical protein HQM12_08020 [SAR324 cluster bacterium]|nr:hypothetical protein [SAR324 cluster bacterium]